MAFCFNDIPQIITYTLGNEHQRYIRFESHIVLFFFISLSFCLTRIHLSRSPGSGWLRWAIRVQISWHWVPLGGARRGELRSSWLRCGQKAIRVHSSLSLQPLDRRQRQAIRLWKHSSCLNLSKNTWNRLSMSFSPLISPLFLHFLYNNSLVDAGGGTKNQLDTERKMEMLLQSQYGGLFSQSSHDAEFNESQCK